MSPKLNVIIASTRPGRIGPTVAKWFSEFAETEGNFDVELVDLADFKLPLLDEPMHPAMMQYQHAHTKAWSRSVASADAYLIVTPEYDFFAPAGLVNAIQAVMREWSYKPAGIVSYGGISGGLRASQVVRQLLGNVNAVAIAQSVPLPFVQQFVGDDGAFRPSEPVVDGTKVMLNELQRWTVALASLREPKTEQKAAA